MSSPGSLRYAPGLDGVRALAVSAVVAYHLATTGGATTGGAATGDAITGAATTAEAITLPGGFLGVDVFFVLSGYLITSLLIVEVRQRGRISLGQFYLRRARRLLPALFGVLLTLGMIAIYWLPELAAKLRGDLLASLGYVTNWWLIIENSSYFGADGERPNPLTHLWSLAVEEQYYLIWPLVLMLFAALKVRRGLMLTLVVLAIAGSTVAGLLLYDPYSDPSRVYYGTDTRALAPLTGAALAILVQPWRHRADIGRGRRLSIDLLGVAALAALGGIAWVVSDTDEDLYRGGFLVIALLGGMLVGVAGHPASRLGRLLGWAPLRWLGERSYAIYLWHWPLFVLTRPGVDIPLTGWQATAARIAAVLLLAEASYWLIERPIRRYGFLGRAGTRLRPSGPRPVVVGAATAAGAGAGVGAGQVYWGSHSRRSPWLVLRASAMSLALLACGGLVAVQLTSSTTPVGAGPVDNAPDETLGPPLATPSQPVPTPSTAGRPAPPPVHKGAKAVFFGDSQAMTLLLNKPANLGDFLKTVDATIPSCGILLGKLASRSGERRNLTANCPNWLPEWASDAKRLKPDVAIIMIGAWEVFSLTTDDGKTLAFGTPAWDQNFTAALASGINAVRGSSDQVALSLLPCYRPLKKSAGFWPERGDDDRTRHVNELIIALVATYQHAVRTLEPPKEFCTKPSIANNTAYRWDGVHYYKKGAALYFNAILPQLFEPSPSS